MSREAQDVLIGLMNESKAIRMGTFKRAKDVSEADAAAVFEELAARCRQEQDLSANDSVLSVLLQWVEKRVELTGEGVVLLESLSPSALGAWCPPLVQGIWRTAGKTDAAKKLLKTWSEAEGNRVLARAAQNVLKAEERRKG